MSIDTKRALMRGAFWQLSTRWSIKLLGLVNTAILARLLLPADYGVIAMSMMVVGIIGSLLDFGVGSALLRKETLSRDEIDSAWSLRIIQGLLVGGLVLLAAPLAAMYFEEPRVLTVLGVLAVCVPISSAGNIGFVLAEKAFDFGLLFRQQVYGKLVSVLGAAIGGWIFRDYRALLLGLGAGYLSGLLTSYLMHPYRPRWNTRELASLWGTSKWLMLGGMGGYILSRGDELLAARLGSTTDYGQYHVGSDLGQMPTSEVGPSMLKAFLPVLASMQGSVDQVNSVVVKALAAVNTVTLPLGLGFAALATPVTLLMLGPGWVGASAYLTAFAIFGAISAAGGPLGPLLFYRGHARLQTLVVWGQFVVFVFLGGLFYRSDGLLGLVYGRIAGEVLRQACHLYLARRHCDLSVRQCLSALWRPLGGAVLMHGLVSWVDGQLIGVGASEVARLVFGVLLGVCVYVLWMLASWRSVGCPAGLEAMALSLVRRRRFE